MIQHENRSAGAAAGQGQAQQLSPWVEQLVKAALPHAPKDGSIEAKAEFLRGLADKLVALREFEKFDPWPMESVVLKRGYRKVAKLQGHTDRVECLQALPDGRIVSGSYDNTLRVWARGADGEWNREVLSGHTGIVWCLQALPDGRIVSGSYDEDLRVWTRSAKGKWSSEVLSGHTYSVRALQALPDGRIMSGSFDSSIRIWDGTPVEGCAP